MNGLKKLNDLLFPGAKTYERVGAGKAVALGFQHAFAMSCATILVPLLTGLDVGVALLAAGLGTLVFHLCTGGKSPVFLGSSFAFIAATISLCSSSLVIGISSLACGPCPGAACLSCLNDVRPSAVFGRCSPAEPGPIRLTNPARPRQ